MRKIKLVTYTPLCYNIIGLNAIENNNFKPFIDSSCRREPDLENKYPSITALCRGSRLAPQLKEKDIVVYFTKPQKFKISEKYLKKGIYNLTSILEVKKVLNSHEEGRKWYEKNNLEIPSNCMTETNSPLNFDKTGGFYSTQREMKDFLTLENTLQKERGKILIKGWDKHYKDRAKKHSNFIITESIYKNLQTPIEITIETLNEIFGKVPNTQSPYNLSEIEYQKLLNLATPANKV